MTETTTTSDLAVAKDAEGGFEHRLRLTAIGWLYKLLFPVAIAGFVLTVVAIPLVLVTVGLPLLLIAVPLLQLHADAERSLAGQILGGTVDAAYRPTRAGGPLTRLRGWAGDPARWRDLAVLPVAFTIGFVLVVVVDAFFLATLWYLVFPFVFWVTPDGVFDTDYGVWVLDTQVEAFSAWVLAAGCFALWWWATPPLLRARARLARTVLSRSRGELERRVAEVSRSRADTVDFSAAELRRIERDLHDGAQARLVSLGMSLGLAEELVHRDPAAAARLLEEARLTTTSALGDLRTVVRGILPPVLADRGLVGAVQALALDLPIPVSVRSELGGRPAAPIESAVYFTVAEALANVVKHAGATQAWVEFGYRGGRLCALVGDDGRGGADPHVGTGLTGLARRLAAFDATMAVSSPSGGPTLVTVEVPCALSSPKT